VHHNRLLYLGVAGPQTFRIALMLYICSSMSHFVLVPCDCPLLTKDGTQGAAAPYLYTIELVAATAGLAA
jgi:hypothetical protein